MTDLQVNLRRGYQPLRSRRPDFAAHAEGVRNRVHTDLEAHLARLRATDPAAAVEMEQKMKLLRLMNRADWWIRRANLSALSILEGP